MSGYVFSFTESHTAWLDLVGPPQYHDIYQIEQVERADQKSRNSSNV